MKNMREGLVHPLNKSLKNSQKHSRSDTIEKNLLSISRLLSEEGLIILQGTVAILVK